MTGEKTICVMNLENIHYVKDKDIIYKYNNMYFLGIVNISKSDESVFFFLATDRESDYP